MRRDAGITLVEIMAAATILAIVLALFIPVQARAARHEKLKTCQAHLHALYQGHSAAPQTKDQDFGRAYWVRLVKANPPLVSAENLRCPLVDESDAPYCQYLGPAENLSKFDAKDPIGSDMEQNHSHDRRQGGNILLKSGEVVNDAVSLWNQSFQSGRLRP